MMWRFNFKKCKPREKYVKPKYILPDEKKNKFADTINKEYLRVTKNDILAKTRAKETMRRCIRVIYNANTISQKMTSDEFFEQMSSEFEVFWKNAEEAERLRKKERPIQLRLDLELGPQ